MDVKRRVVEYKLNEYIRWLEVAIRAQVMCTSSFSRRYAEIRRFILSGAQGQMYAQDRTDAFCHKFDRLVELARAVTAKYRIRQADSLRNYLNSDL